MIIIDTRLKGSFSSANQILYCSPVAPSAFHLFSDVTVCALWGKSIVIEKAECKFKATSTNSIKMLVFEEAERRIQEVGGFSSKLEEVLLYMLKDSKDIRDTIVKENEAMRAETEKRLKEMEKQVQDDTNRLKEIIKKENEERQRDMKDIEGFVKKENADRKRETQEISDKMAKEEERRWNFESSLSNLSLIIVIALET